MHQGSPLARRGFLQRSIVGAGAIGLVGPALFGEPPPSTTQTDDGTRRVPATELPLPTIPCPKSDAIQGIRWLGSPLHYNNNGDVWTCTWADDGHLYSVADDTAGWNLSVYRVEGVPPKHAVTRVNEMKDYQKAGQNGWWKGAGLVSVDSVLYLGVYCQSNPRRGSATGISFNADHATIVKSVDHGQTWTPQAPKATGDNAKGWTTDRALFPGKEFPTPFFVQFGKDYAGAMDEFVYAVSNDGGWNNWNRMLLARVPRKKIGDLNPADWEFCSGVDAQGRAAWDRHASAAGAVFEHKGYTSMTGIQYVPAVNRFVLGQWAYIAMQGGGDRAAPGLAPPWPQQPRYQQADRTMLCLYEAPKPWGPWRLFHAQPRWGPAFYNPNFPAKWFGRGGRTMWIVEGGNYRGPQGGYNFTVQELELIV